MSEAGTEKTEISFVHLSDDVIIPEGLTKYDAAAKLLPKYAFGICGVLGILLLLLMGITLKNFLVSFGITMGFALFISAGATNEQWYEIDRKEGVINRWSNKRKRKKLTPIKKENLVVTFRKVVVNPKTVSSRWALYAQGSDRGKPIDVEMFILPKGTEEQFVGVLAKKIESFLHDFIDGKQVAETGKTFPLKQ